MLPQNLLTRNQYAVLEGLIGIIKMETTVTTGTSWLVETRNETETCDVGRELGLRAKPGDIFLLEGPLGSGKSVLAHGLALGLGISRWRGSPTFNLVHEYQGRLPFYHLDVYRLEGDEIGDLGMEEMLAAGGVIAVEWGEKALPYLVPFAKLAHIYHVIIEQRGPNQRQIEVRS
jgi:tRNA threonylcarbamoyladenosine biosynthesis protein TsaE